MEFVRRNISALRLDRRKPHPLPPRGRDVPWTDVMLICIEYKLSHLNDMNPQVCLWMHGDEFLESTVFEDSLVSYCEVSFLFFLPVPAFPDDLICCAQNEKLSSSHRPTWRKHE